jgi:hypothetical protein
MIQAMGLDEIICGSASSMGLICAVCLVVHFPFIFQLRPENRS